MTKDYAAMGTFSSSSKPCLDDLKVFSSVANVANMTRLVNITSLPGDVQQSFDRGMDFEAVLNNQTRATFIVFNASNYWQATEQEMSGTLLHEIIHLANYTLSDSDIAKKLGVSVSATDTSSISKKLTTDCFPVPK